MVSVSVEKLQDEDRRQRLSAEGVGVLERGDLDFGERGSSTVEARRRGKLLPSDRKLADLC